MPYVPADQKGTDYYIFEKMFWCRVPFNQSRSVEHIRAFGTPASGDPGLDRGTANELVDRMLTIERMVQYWKGGTQVYVKNRDDCKQIYEYISSHLQGWKNHLENSLNVGDAPVQDLIDLDQFANVVYSHAKYQFDNTFIEDVLQRRMSQVLQVSRSQMFVKKPPTVMPEDTRSDEDRLAEQYPDRDGMGDIFARRLQSGSLNRGLIQSKPVGPSGSEAPVPGIIAKWK